MSHAPTAAKREVSIAVVAASAGAGVLRLPCGECVFSFQWPVLGGRRQTLSGSGPDET